MLSPTRTRRGAALTAALLTAALVATGCGSAEKQAAVKNVARAARDLGVRTGTLSLTIEPGPGAPAANPLTLAQSSGPAGLPATAGLILDPAHGAAALIAPSSIAGKLSSPVLTFFDHKVIYSRTADGNTVGARPWYQLDAAHLGALNHYTAQDLENPATLGDLVVMNPLTLIQQVDGLLTGSVEMNRAARVDSPTTSAPMPAIEYSGNTSLEKVARYLNVDPDTEKPTRDLLDLFAADDDINPISIWLSPAGALLRIKLTYISQPLKRVGFRIVYDLTLDAPGSTSPNLAELTAPPAASVVQVQNLGELSLALAKLGAKR